MVYTSAEELKRLQNWVSVSHTYKLSKKEALIKKEKETITNKNHFCALLTSYSQAVQRIIETARYSLNNKLHFEITKFYKQHKSSFFQL